MDFQQIAADLVKNIRGKKSQAAINKKFDFQYNRCSRWETGKSKVQWQEFVKLCHFCHIDLSKATWEVLCYQGKKFEQEFFEHLIPKQMIPTLAREMNYSEDSLYRWRKEQGSISLDQVLQIIQIRFTLLEAFVVACSNEEPSFPFRLEAVKHLEISNFFNKHPISHLVLRLFDSEKPQQINRQEIKKATGLDDTYLEFILSMFLKFEIYEIKEGAFHAKQKWDRLEIPRTANTQDSSQVTFWLQRQSEIIHDLAYEELAGRVTAGIRIFCCSQQIFSELKDLHAETYQKIKDILANAPNGDGEVLGVYTSALTNLTELPRQPVLENEAES